MRADEARFVCAWTSRGWGVRHFLFGAQSRLRPVAESSGSREIL